MASSMLITFHSLTLVYGGIFGSCKISSNIDIALEACTACECCDTCKASIAFLAALLIFRGVVLSSSVNAVDELISLLADDSKSKKN